MKFKTLDDARIAYLNDKITREEFYAYLRRNAIVDEARKNIEKNNNKIERKLTTV
ncbi:hypothetical protein [uncultured Metabacillus sp.]|uniref:hypothetical protein n=1 Tax=uncultured Metabacillus sp. TaxID=2860135 RepID=UPI002615244E|nr:hypothetical protein [uncultured Metabacillus sp.]